MEKTKRKRRPMMTNYAMSNKDLKKHVSVMKIIMKDGYGHEFAVCGETHSISKFSIFGTSACTLGYVYAEKTGTETVRLPVDMVWQLSDFASTLSFGTDTVKASVAEVLKMADQLLTDRRIYDRAEVPEKSSVTFKLHGKKLRDFLGQLHWTFHMGL